MSFSNIAMCDLKGQYDKISADVNAAIQDVLNNSSFIKGREVTLFQDELAQYLGAKHVIACANGTDALQIALMALDLKPGDEVITPDFTFIATVEVVALLGLTPVLVDVDPDTYNLDTAALEKAITPRTRAIIPVHLFGQCANMEQIMAIASKYNIFVVEDNAQAIGADYTFSNGSTQKAGTIGHIGCTSFFPSKNLGCYGDGGALFTNDDALAEEIRSISNHGMKVRYHHDRIGVNSRLDTIQAAVLRIKLRNLDLYCDSRRSAADLYDNLLGASSKLQVPVRSSFSSHVFHQYTLRLLNGNRDEVIKKLAEVGIPAMVYYPIPLHKQKAFDVYQKEARNKAFPNSAMLSQQVFSLPMHTELTPELVTFIAESVLKSVE